MKENGEILDEKQTVKVMVVDQEKAQKDALYDGYFAIITNGLDYDVAKYGRFTMVCGVLKNLSRL